MVFSVINIENIIERKNNFVNVDIWVIFVFGLFLSKILMSCLVICVLEIFLEFII